MHCREYICRIDSRRRLRVKIRMQHVYNINDRNYSFDDRLRVFLSLFERPRFGAVVNDDIILGVLPSVIRSNLGVTHDILNKGLYAAAQNKYFRCVACLVHDFGAVFDRNALLSLVLSNDHDSSYSFEDVRQVVLHAAGAGLDPNAMDASGRTLLHIYCEKVAEHRLCGHQVNLEIVRWMVEWGVSPYVVDRTRKRQTALDILQDEEVRPPFVHESLYERDEIERIKGYLRSVSMTLRPRGY